MQGCKLVPETMGIDTWAVDFVLMGADGRPVSDAVAYRDKRTKGAMEQAERGLPRSRSCTPAQVSRSRCSIPRIS